MIVIIVPSVLNLLANSLLIKVPWLQQSNMAYVLNSFLDLLNFILTGTTHMPTRVDFILVVAYNKETLFFPESLPSPVLFFFLAL